MNHEGNLDLAKRLICLAQEGGADAAKFQTYRAETLAVKDSPAYWDTSKEPARSQYRLFKRYDSFWKKEFEILKKTCDDAGITFLSTPFDLESASFLSDLMPVFKISSSDITNRPFIEALCNYGKPVLLSTGASDLWEIEEAVHWIRTKGNPLALMHCVLNYPTENRHANLQMISCLKRQFPETVIGYSDHTEPGNMKTLEIAALLGAEILEKHFTHDKSLPGNDHYHAMDAQDLKAFFRQFTRDFELLGDYEKRALESEAPARRNARRSLVAARAIPKGKVIETGDLTWKRPAFGISPKEIGSVIGSRAAVNIGKDKIIYWQDIEPA